MNSFPTIIRTRHVGAYELKAHDQPRKFFDVWIEIESVIHQVFLLANELKEVEDLTIMPILTGGGVFNTILGQKLNKQAPDKPVIEVPVVARSYGAGQQSGSLQIYSGWIQREQVDFRNVVIVDDIFDTGKTASDVTDLVLDQFRPLSIKRAFLVRKNVPGVPYNPDDYYLFELPGYSELGQPIYYAGMGMDWHYRYRNLDRVIDINSGRLQK